jgi:hypothetical protein
MREFFTQALEFAFGEKGLIIGTYFLTIVTGMDAEIGRRIYTRMAKLITMMTPAKAVTPEPTPEPEPIKVTTPLMARNQGHW